ncbi:protein MTSS 1 isoform X3 [Salmo salar]|uniref:Protein MTSS 1 isoform X3 n=1 Tax=Salmo salar TaxID=8030 RepID=A0A1S3M1V1_SALSA|nr:protein MTSS 1-like isoform X3 [Salmo salar]|eukprot:XP_013997140.1 PREDICTED: metastasis suppressor protein 1-like isoform X3 [Salmo salar]
METVIERECSALGGLFQTVIGDMKSSYPVWDDFISKAGKLQSQLRTTVVAVAAFLDAFQKVADLATGSRGGTRDIGSALTRMCMRHRSIEAKLRQFSMIFIDCLINPLQDQMEEWKRVANTLDKDHAKEYKKARQEIKKKSSDTLKLQKKAKKGRGDIQPQLDNAMQDISDKYLLLEETEKQAVRKALVEERSRFCTFVSMLRPVVEEEMSMLGEITHLQTLTDDLKALTMDPHKLPPTSEQVILDLKGSESSWSYHTPPSSPSTTASRKSSMCSSLNSVNSSDSRSSGSHCHSPTSHYRYRSSALPQQGPARLSSVSSHDSGFISQDAYQSKSPSPMPSDTNPQLSNVHDHQHHGPSTALYLSGGGMQEVYPDLPPSSPSTPLASSSYSPTSPVWAWSRPGSALLVDYPPYCALGPGMIPSSKVPTWKDWAKPGPYDQPMVNTLRRTKEKRETPNPSSPQATTPGDEPQRAKGTNAVTTAKQEEAEAHEELALALARGLQLDIQHSSRDSLQCSSGYSTQNTTPCCSEDTIPSQVSDYDYFSVGGDQETDQPDFNKSSTIPRNSDISQSYRRMFQAKRPASTAGIPPTAPSPGSIVTPGVATIRRTPSSKPNLRRSSGGLGLGPIPIKPPMIPVKTPTVPEHPGLFFRGESEGGGPLSPLSSAGDNGLVSPKAPWDAQASSDPPTPPPQPGSRLSEWDREALPEVQEEEPGCGEGEDVLLAIRRGVKLKKTTSNDRSAPRIV